MCQAPVKTHLHKEDAKKFKQERWRRRGRLDGFSTTETKSSIILKKADSGDDSTLETASTDPSTANIREELNSRLVNRKEKPMLYVDSTTVPNPIKVTNSMDLDVSTIGASVTLDHKYSRPKGQGISGDKLVEESSLTRKNESVESILDASSDEESHHDLHSPAFNFTYMTSMNRRLNRIMHVNSPRSNLDPIQFDRSSGNHIGLNRCSADCSHSPFTSNQTSSAADEQVQQIVHTDRVHEHYLLDQSKCVHHSIKTKYSSNKNSERVAVVSPPAQGAKVIEKIDTEQTNLNSSEIKSRDHVLELKSEAVKKEVIPHHDSQKSSELSSTLTSRKTQQKEITRSLHRKQLHEVGAAAVFITSSPRLASESTLRAASDAKHDIHSETQDKASIEFGETMEKSNVINKKTLVGISESPIVKHRINPAPAIKIPSATHDSKLLSKASTDYPTLDRGGRFYENKLLMNLD